MERADRNVRFTARCRHRLWRYRHRLVAGGGGMRKTMKPRVAGTSEPEKLLSRVRLSAIPWTVAYQAPPSLEFSRQESCSGLPCPSPKLEGEDKSRPDLPGLPVSCQCLPFQLSHSFHLTLHPLSRGSQPAALTGPGPAANAVITGLPRRRSQGCSEPVSGEYGFFQRLLTKHLAPTPPRPPAPIPRLHSQPLD